MDVLQSYNPFGDKRAYIAIASIEDRLLFRNKVVWKKQPSDVMHTVAEGETIEGIAQRYYQNIRENAQNYWSFIIDANEVDGLYIMNPLDLSDLVGKEIRIPTLQLIDFVAG
jgi:hypothetical protein